MPLDGLMDHRIAAGAAAVAGAGMLLALTNRTARSAQARAEAEVRAEHAQQVCALREELAEVRAKLQVATAEHAHQIASMALAAKLAQEAHAEQKVATTPGHRVLCADHKQKCPTTEPGTAANARRGGRLLECSTSEIFAIGELCGRLSVGRERKGGPMRFEDVLALAGAHGPAGNVFDADDEAEGVEGEEHGQAAPYEEYRASAAASPASTADEFSTPAVIETPASAPPASAPPASMIVMDDDALASPGTALRALLSLPASPDANAEPQSPPAPATPCAVDLAPKTRGAPLGELSLASQTPETATG